MCIMNKGIALIHFIPQFYCLGQLSTQNDNLKGHSTNYTQYGQFIYNWEYDSAY